MITSFNSPHYLVFLALVVLLYWRLPLRRQNLMLLAASWIFYGSWDWRFLGLFVFTTAFDFGVALRIESSEGAARRRYLLASLAVHLTVLLIFKYSNFFIHSAAEALETLGLRVPRLTLEVLLPVGISFYTFQSIGYIVDVYRRDIRAVRSFVDYALFLAFFPQLVAGPIERAWHLLRQVETPRVFRKRQFWNGLDLIFWGLVKKTVIADNVGYYVDRLFSLGDASTLLIAVGTLGFGAQILADFSAYSDIARGSAKLMGFEVMKNFRRPYLARNVVDFWRRWHISLSLWVRDYIYVPLGGSRCSRGRMTVNILVTWWLCGLWHGAAWNFVLWGLYHGVLVAAFQLWAERPRWQLPRWLAVALTFTLVHLGWLLFRMPSVAYLGRVFSAEALAASAADIPAASAIIGVFLVFLMPHLVRALWERTRRGVPLSVNERWAARGLSYGFSGLVIFIFGRFGAGDFIYFQF